MTHAALQEVRKSRQLIAQIMATSPTRQTTSPVQYFVNPSGTKLRVASPQSYKLTVTDIQSPTQHRQTAGDRRSMDSETLLKKGKHKRQISQTSTRFPQTTVTTQHSFAVDNSTVDSNQEPQKKSSNHGSRAGTPSRNLEPPSLSGSFDGAVKWNRPHIFGAAAYNTRDSIAEEEGSCGVTPPEENKCQQAPSENSNTSLVAFLKDMSANIKPRQKVYLKPHENAVTISQQTSTSGLYSDLDQYSITESRSQLTSERVTGRQQIDTNQCPAHPKEQSLYFCEETKELFCVYCAFNYRQKEPQGNIKDLKLKFHELRVHMNSLNTKQQRERSQVGAIEKKLTQNREAVGRAVTSRYEEVLSQLKDECQNLLSQIAEISKENDHVLGTKKRSNQERERKIMRWLQNAKQIEARPNRKRFLELMKDYEEIVQECNRTLEESQKSGRGLQEFQTIDYNPPQGIALIKSKSLGAVFAIKLQEQRGDRNSKATFRKKKNRNLSTSSLDNLSLNSATAFSNEMQYSFGGIGDQSNEIVPPKSLGATIKIREEQEPKNKMQGNIAKKVHKQLSQETIDNKSSKVSTANKPTMAHSRAQSRQAKFHRVGSSKQFENPAPSLIEELEASAFSAKRHHIIETQITEITEIKEEPSISTKVITRAISMARCRATPPLRNGLTEAHSEQPGDSKEVQHTSESMQSDPFLRPASAQPPSRVNSKLDLATNDDLTSENISHDHFLNPRISISSKASNIAPKIPLDQIKLTTSSRGRNASNSKLPSSLSRDNVNETNNSKKHHQSGKRLRKQPSETFSPGGVASTVKSRGMRMDTLGSPISSQPEFTDDLTPYSEDSRSNEDSIPIEHLPKMSRDQSYLNLGGEDSDYSASRLPNNLLTEMSNITRKNTNLAITPKLAAFGDIDEERSQQQHRRSSSRIKSLTPRDLSSPDRRKSPNKGHNKSISGRILTNPRDYSFRSKLKQMMEKSQRRHSRHAPLGSNSITSSHSTQHLKCGGMSSATSSIKLIPTDGGALLTPELTLSYKQETANNSDRSPRQVVQVTGKQGTQVHHLVKADKLTTEAEEINRFMGARYSGSRSVTPLSHFSVSSGMEERKTPSRKVTDPSVSMEGKSALTGGGQLLFNNRLSSKPLSLEGSRNIPDTIEEQYGSGASGYTSTWQSQKEEINRSFEIPRIDLEPRDARAGGKSPIDKH